VTLPKSELLRLFSLFFLAAPQHMMMRIVATIPNSTPGKKPAIIAVGGYPLHCWSSTIAAADALGVDVGVTLSTEDKEIGVEVAVETGNVVDGPV